VVFHLGLKEIEHALFGELGVVQVDPPADQQQRDQGTEHGQQDKFAEKPRIPGFALGGRSRSLARVRRRAGNAFLEKHAVLPFASAERLENP